MEAKKKFDAVEMSRRLRAQTGRLLASMKPEEQVAFLNRRLVGSKKTARRAKLAV
jgi:hypothetical protein